MKNCLFCQITAREIPSDIVAETDEWVAFRDIHPLAPTHVLVVPRQHIASLQDLPNDQAGLAGRLMLAAKRVAEAEGVSNTGYRVVTNIGPDAGQVVAHLHFHVIGGKYLGSKTG